MIIETVRAVLLEDSEILSTFDERIYPTQLPDAPTYPAAVLTKITGRGQYDLDGDVGIEDARVQIDVYSTAGEADCIFKKNLIRRRLSGFVGSPSVSPAACAIQTCLCINDFALSESATERAGPRLWRRILEFRIFNTEV